MKAYIQPLEKNLDISMDALVDSMWFIDPDRRFINAWNDEEQLNLGQELTISLFYDEYPEYEFVANLFRSPMITYNRLTTGIGTIVFTSRDKEIAITEHAFRILAFQITNASCGLISEDNQTWMSAEQYRTKYSDWFNYTKDDLLNKSKAALSTLDDTLDNSYDDVVDWRMDRNSGYSIVYKDFFPGLVRLQKNDEFTVEGLFGEDWWNSFNSKRRWRARKLFDKGVKSQYFTEVEQVTPKANKERKETIYRLKEEIQLPWTK